MEPIHDRMPVILADDAADEWLFEETCSRRPALIGCARSCDPRSTIS